MRADLRALHRTGKRGECLVSGGFEAQLILLRPDVHSHSGVISMGNPSMSQIYVKNDSQCLVACRKSDTLKTNADLADATGAARRIRSALSIAVP